MRSGRCCIWVGATLLVAGIMAFSSACGDDGGNDNLNNSDDDAATTSCGNGQMEGIEECDDGPANSDTLADACRTDCRLPGCGDGVVDDTEECDEGPQNSDEVPDACRSDCGEPSCGDGVVDVASGESCDDGNTVADDGCSPNCIVEHCGNGVVDPGEVCDDGNFLSGDGCSASCNSDETCGNGVVDLLATPPELCDDGNQTIGDGCSDTCQIEVCGNGHLDPGEVCDDGNLLPRDGCSPDCQSDETCGNLYPDFLAGEQCDDGNHLSHDGCSSGCTGEFPIWTRYAEALGPVSNLSMAYDSARERLVAIGGSGFCGPYCDVTFEHDGVRWRVVQTANSPTARRHAMLAYDSVRGVMVLFGGSQATVLGDTWEYDGTDWTQVTPATSPPPRESAAMTYDANRGVVVLFGGVDFSAEFGDTWEYDGATWVQRTTANAPIAVANCKAVYDSQRQLVVLVGGNTMSTSLNETWEYDGTDWTLVDTTVWYRSHQAMAYDPVRGVTVLQSGFSSNVAGCTEPLCDDLWEYDGNGWTRISTTGPGPRRDHVMAYHGALGGVVLFGGADFQNIVYDDTWLWNGTVWESLSEGARPTERSRHALVYDSLRNRLVMFGGDLGSSDTTVPAETWLFEDGGWRRLPCPQPADCPASRSGLTMAYDEARDRVVLFGGGFGVSGVYTAFADTWEFDGTAWNQATPTASPPGRTVSAMAYDPVAGRVVLFGGQTDSSPGSTAFDDTWEYDGTTWVQITTTATPPARGVHVMTWDASNQEMVMMGGIDDQATGLTDTWTYDGLNWTYHNLSQAPAARGVPVLVFDPLRNRTVLYGGITLTGYLDDSWEWDGTSWTQVYSNPPSPRGFLAAAYHEGLKKVAVFGGFNGLSLDDMYFFQYGSQWPEEVCDSGLDLDNDGDTDCADPDCDGQTCGSGMVCTGGACVTP